MGIFSKSRDSEGNVGGWNVSSETDPRWNGNGRSYGMWAAIEDANKHVSAKAEVLGAPPKDLNIGWWKD
jgi:hypothetical protein